MKDFEEVILSFRGRTTIKGSVGVEPTVAPPSTTKRVIKFKTNIYCVVPYKNSE
jgi:hypothetical protein